ncbi:M16 family metallopeptidase [Prevotella sp. AGR2160]|uniref:M16 family metallopeptidase n=1 Tax=Prevotella sp. AGR2160 TaxID=1280674 RepID=UPI00048F9519
MRLKRFFFAGLMAAGVALSVQAYNYETVPGDPMQARIYTLPNGLKVYMSVNKEKPRLQTYIAVRTGSRNDPKETTGLAHYLEHLMFKGTKQFGTSNYEKERPLLDSIEARFEKYRYIVNAQERKRWYHQIDSLSQLAAQYNIPNEYDKMMTAIGSEGSNAYTSNDQTCYQEDIPSNEIENWAKIQSDRFQNMVIRGFHTELEAVYEEYNIGLANDGRKEWNALNKILFPTHPYGTQTTIGTQEHLKNPSIANIKNYFHKYYVPNNVAIVLAGDFDPDKTIALIDKYFGSWKKSDNLSYPQYAPVADLKAHKDTTVVGQEAENIIIGWKFDKAASLQNDTLQVIADVLANGKAGLFDVDLTQPMKIMEAGAASDDLRDYSEFYLEGVPRQGQKLEEVRDLLLAEIDKLKKGDFDDNLVSAVVANKRLQFLRGLDKNVNRVEVMKDAFINGKDWRQEVGGLDRMAKMTKAQIVAFANKYIGDNYACVYKRQGNDTTIHKIEKPQITPIPTNNDKHSDFLQAIVNSNPAPIQPRFLDFNKDLTKGKMKDGSTVLYKQNTTDDLFNLSFVYPVGSENDKRTETAADYLNFVGTATRSAADIQKAFYQLACDYNVSVSGDETRINLSGLNQNFPKALALLKDYIYHAKADTASYHKFVGVLEKSRKDAKANQRMNFYALRQYGIYGPYNSMRNAMNNDELAKADPQQLLDMLKGLGSYTLLYYGPSTLKALTTTVSKNNFNGRRLACFDKCQRYTEEATPKTEIYLAPYDAKNIYMIQYHNDHKTWKPEETAVADLFNEYFGGGMNAIVFQELREARGLAYSAGAYYNLPSRKGDYEDFWTYIITQNDKMMDCVNEFNNLLTTIPTRPAGFDLARQSLMKSLATARTTKFSILNAYLRAQKRGIDYDLNSRVYEELPKLTLDDVLRFGKENISGKPYRYLILGNEKDLDMKALEKIGPVKRLTTDEIFGL